MHNCATHPVGLSCCSSVGHGLWRACHCFFLPGRLCYRQYAEECYHKLAQPRATRTIIYKAVDFMEITIILSSTMSSDLLTDYLQRRANLIKEDRALRKDYVRTYNAAEQKADEVVRCIRAKEAVTVWGNKHGDVPHQYPGMEFLNGTMLATHLALRLTSAYSQRYHFEDGAVQKNSLQSKHSKSSCLPPPT